MTDWILWNFNQRGWAMSQGTDYVIRDDIQAQSHFDAVTASGKKWAAYFSQWFYYSRDPAEWVNAVQAWRDEYGMGAMYSDGLAQDDWLSAYKAMRLMRGQVFPDGDIIIHDSYLQSGVPTAQYKPYIYSYATSTYMGENAVVPVGEDWVWARYGMNMYRGGNAFGVTKGDGWTLGDSVDKYLIGLVWGGRGRPDVAEYDSRYRSALLSLKTMWETYGEDPFFFDRYYHPEAQELTGYNIGRAGMPIFDLDTLANGDVTVALSSWSPGAVVRYTTDGSAPTAASTLFGNAITVNGELRLRARSYRADLEESALAELNIVTGTLPVGWAFVSATATDDCNHVEVRWQTSFEEAVAGFVVERNDQLGDNWEAISATILPGQEEYVHLDEQSLNAISSYRVRQVDFDGTLNYSPVVSELRGSCREETVTAVFPNPTTNRLTVMGTPDLNDAYTVVDAFGRELLSGTLTSSRTNIDLSALPAGVYWLLTSRQSKRFIKL